MAISTNLEARKKLERIESRGREPVEEKPHMNQLFFLHEGNTAHHAVPVGGGVGGDQHRLIFPGDARQIEKP